MTDNLPIFGYRRKSYILVFGLLTVLAWFGQGEGWRTPTWVVFATIVTAEVGIGVIAVVLRAMVSELVLWFSRDESRSEKEIQAYSSSVNLFAMGGVLLGILVT